jgi:hypothetical protein
MEWIPVFTGMTKRGTGMASPSVTPRSGSDEGSPSLLKKGKRRFSRLNTLPQNNSVDLSFPNVSIGNPESSERLKEEWIPFFKGMTQHFVIPDLIGNPEWKRESIKIRFIMEIFK